MTDPLRVGVIGCGRIARMFHLPVLAGLEAVRVTAVADPDPQARTAAAAAVPGSAAFADHEAVLASGAVDAVVVCAPSGAHADIAVAAFDAGAHAYVEKPLAVAEADADRVLTAWRRSQRVGMVGLNLRFHPLRQRLRTAVATGEHGTTVAARHVFCSAPRALPGWKQARAHGGGVLLDLVTHQVDAVRHVLAAPIAQVAATTRSVRTEDDTAAVTLQLADGTAVQLLASMTAPAVDRLEVVGDAATVTADRFGGRRLRREPAAVDMSRRGRVRRALGQLAALPTSVADTVVPPGEPSFAAALAAFADAARRGDQAAPTVADGYESLRVVLAAEAAARRRQPVAVERGPASG